MALYDYQIAAGHNNAAGLANVETLTDAGGNLFKPPSALGTYQAGEVVPTLSGSIAVVGSAFVVWNWTMLTTQYAYLKTTYCAGGYTGLVTIRTATEQYAVYANYNARLILPQVGELQRISIGYIVPVRFVELEAL